MLCMKRNRCYNTLIYKHNTNNNRIERLYQRVFHPSIFMFIIFYLSSRRKRKCFGVRDGSSRLCHDSFSLIFPSPK